MKTQRIKTLSAFLIALLMLTASNLYAQKGRGYARNKDFNKNQVCERIPDLTEEQETKIKELRVDHLKEMKSFRNQMNELRARKRTLMTLDNADLKEINSVIDQMTETQNQMMKATAKHRQEIRNLLTDEQRIFFDSRPMRGPRHGKSMRYGRGMYGGYCVGIQDSNG